jgi:hypothetical protein
MYSAPSPVTPAAKRAGSDSRPTSKLQDSPFSDYFTDDGSSNNNGNGSSYRAPSAETQQLLVRLNKLQAQLMRSSPEDILSEHEKAVIVGRKVSEIETQFHALSIETQSQTRLPPDLEDSGLFMDEEAENEDTPNAHMESFDVAAKEYLTSGMDNEDQKAKHDLLLQDAQTVLHNVHKANEQLRQLNRELRANHEKCGSIIDSLELENAELRSKTTTLEFDNDASEATSDNLKTENAALKTDLDFNRAELLYLKLHHRSLEVEIEALHNSAHRLGSYAPELREEIHQIKRTKIKERMSAWEDHWVEIEQKMRQRRLRHADSEGEESIQHMLGLEDDDESSAVADEIVEIAQVTQKQPSLLGEDSAVGIEDTPSPPSESLEDKFMANLQIDKSTQTNLPVEEDTRPELESEKPTYLSQETQTTPLPSPATSSWVLASEYDGDEAIQSYTNDCAITTSSEDNGDDDSEDEVSIELDVEIEEEVEVKTPTSPIRAAWHDLWDGLTNLAGMGEGY